MNANQWWYNQFDAETFSCFASQIVDISEVATPTLFDTFPKHDLKWQKKWLLARNVYEFLVSNNKRDDFFNAYEAWKRHNLPIHENLAGLRAHEELEIFVGILKEYVEPQKN
jgi:hypothetical protein